MKTKTVLNILLAAGMLSTSVPACVLSSPSTPSAQPATASTGIPSANPSAVSTTGVSTGNQQGGSDLGSISYTLDTSRQVSKTFDINSGESFILGVKDANGYAWMLTVPADALVTKTEIKMTPFATMDVSHSVARIISGVQLEPDGLQFADAARLTVTAPTDNPGMGLVFSMKQDGSGVDFAPTTNTPGGKTAIATIWHFSSAGYDNAAHAGQDGQDAYRKAAEQDYQWALDAAKLFLRSGTPSPPPPPDISLFCRGTEVNPDEGETIEYSHKFLEPYAAIASYLDKTIKALRLMQEADPDYNPDISTGEEAYRSILEMAEASVLALGTMYRSERPPYKLIAIIDAGQETERLFNFAAGEGALNPELAAWGGIVRDYYLNELKTKHDYRVFPYILAYNKQVELMGGVDRLSDIQSALTFMVDITTSFQGTWRSGDKVTNQGSLEQNAHVTNLRNELTPPDFRWGTLDDMQLMATAGS